MQNQKAPPSPTSPPSSNNITIKLSWGGQCAFFDDYWSFVVGSKLNDPHSLPEETFYYISKKHSLLIGKKLDQEELTYTLTMPDSVVKKLAKVKEMVVGTILESNFNFQPNGPWEDHSDFEKGEKNTQAVKLIKFEKNQYLFCSLRQNQEFRKFAVDRAHPAIKKLASKNKLKVGSEDFLLKYHRIDKQEQTFYYFNQFNNELDIWPRFN
ncbi:MAG: hypothetical protein I3273_01645 [Candidatus Moeniiplasma glomeromycotorum]|nr:hypothetical protein [Candidatus Moeniiplasma glomeromycotorum]MCE8167175.1 hypothetical protein [Candidatus Moeniiplasma glomeromycotorum]MCE8168813.1 hypothetical protein [Candidatus Moeniiplasma glomeromycotorum]